MYFSDRDILQQIGGMVNNLIMKSWQIPNVVKIE